MVIPGCVRMRVWKLERRRCLSSDNERVRVCTEQRAKKGEKRETIAVHRAYICRDVKSGDESNRPGSPLDSPVQLALRFTDVARETPDIESDNVVCRDVRFVLKFLANALQ